MWIKAKNGNVVETDDTDHAKRALGQGHEVFQSDPGKKGAKKWDPDAEADEAAADEAAADGDPE